MIRKLPTPASRKPSTMCCKTGLPRTSSIGFGRSAVISRMRVPRPAASKTALSIFVITNYELKFRCDSTIENLHRPRIFSIFNTECFGVDWLSTCFSVHGSFVTNPPLAIANPFAGIDHGVAFWFHAHLTPTFVSVLRGITEFGSSEWIGVVLSIAVLFFVFKRWWPSLLMMVVAVPGGMLLNEWVKLLVHRHRPFVDGWFVDWSGYSFASGHTIGATLLYGQIALFIIPM